MCNSSQSTLLPVHHVVYVRKFLRWILVWHTSHEREGQYGFTHPEGCPEGRCQGYQGEYDSVFSILTPVAKMSIHQKSLTNTTNASNALIIDLLVSYYSTIWGQSFYTQTTYKVSVWPSPLWVRHAKFQKFHLQIFVSSIFPVPADSNWLVHTLGLKMPVSELNYGLNSPLSLCKIFKIKFLASETCLPGVFVSLKHFLKIGGKIAFSFIANKQYLLS